MGVSARFGWSGRRHLARLAGSIEPLEARTLMAADPVTPDNPLWAIPRGSAVIDGTLSDADWDSALTIFRTQATRNDRAATIRMMWDDTGISMSAEVQDENLWADGMGSGTGNRWEVESDDSLTFYFDPNNSRDEYFQNGDYAFGASIAAWTDSYSGSGAVKRYKYVTGDGAGGAADSEEFNWYDVEQAGLNPWDFFIPTGASYATTYAGTINNSSDTDTGWSMEMYLPWTALRISAPTHGTTMGMNFDLILDQDGSTRNLSDNRDASNRFDVPHFIDDHVQGVHSSYSATLAGIHGPVNYAQAMFIDSRALAKPAAITNLAAQNLSAYGAQLTFTAPAGTTGGLGSVSRYEIRVATSPITSDDAWRGADVVRQTYTPRLAGQSEMLRIAELSPSTTYYVSVRGVDGAGNLGDLSNSASFSTDAAITGDKGRIIPSPAGTMLMHENGEAFVAVGDHLALSWAYTRNLFPGDVWDNANQMYHNFHDEPSYEGTAGPYLDMLENRGINTMRVYLELQNVHYTGNPNPPQGLYWLEQQNGQFNQDMRAFIHNILEECGTRGIHVIFSPFDSFSYDEAFGLEGPWATSMGGPLTDINNFFQDSGTLEIAKARMDTVVSWVQESAYASSVIGYEPVSEWDSYEWTLNAEGNSEPGRETEFRTRAGWIDQLAAYIKQIDPDRLVMNSTIVRDPRGPLAREILYSRTWDVLTPHLYTNSNEEPINNPAEDKSIMLAQETAYFTNYWATHRIDNRPIISGEWGNTRADWPGGVPAYSSSFTQQEDEANYRVAIWSALANGQFGTPLRINTEELAFNGYILTSTMRYYQQTFGRFAASQTLAMDWSHFDADPLAGKVSAVASGHTLHSWGMSDGAQGMVYILNDSNVSASLVSGATLTITGLDLDQLVDVEVWATNMFVTSASATYSAQYAGNGTLSIVLPNFTTDLAIKFRARGSSGQAQEVVSLPVDDTMVTFFLGEDSQPKAIITGQSVGMQQTQDIAAIANFRGQVRDMTPFTTSDGTVHLAITDTTRRVWLISGSPEDGTWTARNLTAEIDADGLTGDLTFYSPSWGSIHIGGLDAQGHAVNYWWAPGLDSWQHSDLTLLVDGPTLSRGLTGYVSGWDGLNLAGLNDSGEVVVYWWAPGLDAWQYVNMTTAFDGPTFSGQLDAFVTAWGGMNIVGMTDEGHVSTYWWAPGLPDDPNRWQVADLTDAAGAPVIAEAVEVATSDDGGINVFAIDAAGDARMLRWTPSVFWYDTSVSGEANSSVDLGMPMGASSSGNLMVLLARSGADLIMFRYDLAMDRWSTMNAA
ncbi:MAG: cellulase family glycosylhydrolase [Phycisphaerales bacterium]|nr:cellulase family glycosylhydrolase [Phycisphaerales bacterium]